MRRGLTFRMVLAGVVVGAVVLGCFAVLVIAYGSMHNAERQDSQAGGVLAASNLLERSVLDLETGLRGYLLSGRTVFLQPYHSAEAAYPAQIRNLDRLTAGQPSLHGRAVRLGDGVTAYVRGWTDPIVDLSSVQPRGGPGQGSRRRGQGPRRRAAPAVPSAEQAAAGAQRAAALAPPRRRDG